MRKKVFIKLTILLLQLLAVRPCGAQDIEDIDVKHPVHLSGNVNLLLESYSATGIQNRKQPFTWMITGNPTLTVYGVDLPFSFLFSNFDNKYYQPFNQFGISPKYKWATAHLGYRNVVFNPFTLGGARMLGGGIELNPGILRFGVMYGRLNRSTTLDTLQNADPLAYRTQLSYTRMAYAVKLGIGSERNYFDVSYLKGWDVESSLAEQYRDTLPPQENAVPGLAWQFTIAKKLVWKTDLGISIYTNNIHGDGIIDSNAPDIAKKAASIFKLNTSTQYLIAGESKIGWHDDNWGFDVAYRRIDPDYKSMGVYFFQTDLEQWTFIPYLKLFINKLIVNGSAGFQHDNIVKLKLATSKRVIGSLNINVNPSPAFGLNANYSNYGITQNPTRTSLRSDLFKQVSQNFTLVPFVNLISGKASENFTLVASYQLLHSPQTSINTSPDQNTLVGSLTYAHTWLNSGLGGNVSINYNNTHIASQGDIGSYGLGLGATIPVWKKKTSVNINASYNSNYFNSNSNGHTINADASCNIPVYKKHTIQLAASYLNNTSKDVSFIQNFSEYIFRVGYGYSF